MTRPSRLAGAIPALFVIALCALGDLAVWVREGGQFAAWGFALNAFALLAVVNAHTLDSA